MMACTKGLYEIVNLGARSGASEMKVVAFNGSPRKEGNTFQLLQIVLQELEHEGIETEIFSLSHRPIRGCVACYQCVARRDQRCAMTQDVVNTCLEKMVESEGMLLGTPTYFADLTAELKALIDRCGMVAKANEDMLKRKVGAAVVAVRRAGSLHAFDSINHFFTISQMIIPGSNYWNMGLGLEKGDVQSDEEGKETMVTLGRNMAWLLQKIAT